MQSISCHAKPTHLARAQQVSAGRLGAGLWDDAICAGMRLYACAGMGITLIERNSSSGRMMVPKGGVSIPAPDSRLRHTRGDSGEEGVAPGPRVHCTVMLYI